MQYLCIDITKLRIEGYMKDIKWIFFYLETCKMEVNFNVFSPLMKRRMIGNINSRLVIKICKKKDWKQRCEDPYRET
jgi:hypothetical protein